MDKSGHDCVNEENDNPKEYDGDTEAEMINAHAKAARRTYVETSPLRKKVAVERFFKRTRFSLARESKR